MSTERATGWGVVGRIPASKVEERALRIALDESCAAFFEAAILSMDSEFIDWMDKELSTGAKGKK